MGILQFFKQWRGLSYGEPIPFNESNVDCFNHHFKDGFLLLSTPRYIISWDMTYQALLDTKFGYVDKDVFYFYGDMIFMGIVLKSVSVPLKIYGHTYRQDIPIRHYEMSINDTQFNELLQKTGMF